MLCAVVSLGACGKSDDAGETSKDKSDSGKVITTAADSKKETTKKTIALEYKLNSDE